MPAESREKNIYSLLQQRYGIIGDSKPMQEAIQRTAQAAPTDLTVLITGETGTGKEVFANAIHGMSNRKKFPFVSVNCGAIPETLLESELFGNEKGAFTGAVDQRKGYFEVAHRGTIFLDEIGEMPIGTQVKLLRVLESGEFSRLGSSAMHKVDVRVIAATNRELEQEVRDGNFRQDLFFRLNSVHIVLPPLRKHIEDIPILVEYFGKRVTEKLGLAWKGISFDALNMLKSLNWPGNVRELRNLVETMVTLEQGVYITPDILTKYLPAALPAHEDYLMPEDKSMVYMPPPDYSGQFEIGLIFRTLLELKHDLTDIKQQVFRMGDSIEALKARVNEQQPSAYVNIPAFEIPGEEPAEVVRIEEMERKLIEAALKKHAGNRREAAIELGISERTLYRKISEFNIK